ncbi:hypothetical protein TESG_02347 [Trichophyton tonsurans CBS 112818]|uniref:Uncharacterized protein n=1 Tax=Trichophyton tonsurans (strain CBS 112818) TaxID=647933 RepID=F2RU46_TRIT1|nr:hypothetical protein TESG_02347 [Trichophyton tonsurans CBS 112818]
MKKQRAQNDKTSIRFLAPTAAPVNGEHLRNTGRSRDKSNMTEMNKKVNKHTASEGSKGSTVGNNHRSFAADTQSSRRALVSHEDEADEGPAVVDIYQSFVQEQAASRLVLERGRGREKRRGNEFPIPDEKDSHVNGAPCVLILTNPTEWIACSATSTEMSSRQRHGKTGGWLYWRVDTWAQASWSV